MIGKRTGDKDSFISSRFVLISTTISLFYLTVPSCILHFVIRVSRAPLCHSTALYTRPCNSTTNAFTTPPSRSPLNSPPPPISTRSSRWTCTCASTFSRSGQILLLVQWLKQQVLFLILMRSTLSFTSCK